MVLSRDQIEFVLFGKEPIAGKVKTRLFPSNPSLSCRFYRAFIKDFALRYERYCSLPLRPLVDGESFLGPYFKSSRILPSLYQGPGSLFHRLALGLSQIDSEFFYLTGTDLPHFPFHYLDEVEIDKDQVTIGPDSDGGFYFFAGPKSCSPLFDIEPSSPFICNELVRNFEKHGYKVKVLKTWSDIDTEKDLVKCLSEFSADELPHTYEIAGQTKMFTHASFI